MNVNELYESVWKEWSSMTTPPEKDMELMEWGWGKNAARAFTGVHPVEVDINSPGFHAASPLMDLPPQAAAAYLGTYLLSLLKGLEFQLSVGLFDDIVTRAHTLTCLTLPSFWDNVIRRHLPQTSQKVVEQVVYFLTKNKDALSLEDKQIDTLLKLAKIE